MSEELAEGTVERVVRVYRGTGGEQVTGYVHGTTTQVHVAFPIEFRWQYRHPEMSLTAMAVINTGNGPPEFEALYECDGGAYAVRRGANHRQRTSGRPHDGFEAFVEEHDQVLWRADERAE